jgi:hypothetical protein
MIYQKYCTDKEKTNDLSTSNGVRKYKSKYIYKLFIIITFEIFMILNDFFTTDFMNLKPFSLKLLLSLLSFLHLILNFLKEGLFLILSP